MIFFHLRFLFIQCLKIQCKLKSIQIDNIYSIFKLQRNLWCFHTNLFSDHRISPIEKNTDLSPANASKPVRSYPYGALSLQAYMFNL